MYHDLLEPLSSVMLESLNISHKIINDSDYLFLGGNSSNPTCLFIDHRDRTINFVNCFYYPRLWYFQDIFAEKFISTFISNLQWFYLDSRDSWRLHLTIKTDQGISYIWLPRLIGGEVDKFADYLLANGVKKRFYSFDRPLGYLNVFVALFGCGLGARLSNPLFGNRRLFNMEIGPILGIIFGVLLHFLLISPLLTWLYYWYLEPRSSFARYLTIARIFIITAMTMFGVSFGLLVNLATIGPEGIGQAWLETICGVVGFLGALFVKINGNKCSEITVSSGSSGS
jgi:hypothetical protein